MKRYGVPYMGSKNFIAEWVVQYLPQATHLYDLFAGGCAITHCAMMQHRFQEYHINDISNSIDLFIKAINGDYANETRWISKEDFDRLKNTDPYIRLLWSFGNNSRQYLYGKDKEPIKKALHYARVLHDTSLLQALNIDLSTIDDRLQATEHLERLQSLQALNNPRYLQHLHATNQDYRTVPILPDSTIYCDPPYKDTAQYGRRRNIDIFDSEAFYQWAREQTQPLVISEYQMPPDFITIAQIKKQNRMTPSSTRIANIEKLFIPPQQEELYQQAMNKSIHQLSIWN